MDLGLKRTIDYFLGGAAIALLGPAARLAGLALRRDHHPHPRGSIDVIKMLGGGSLVVGFPALLGIRRAYPQHRLRLVTTPGVRPFGATLRVFDAFHIVRDDDPLSFVKSAAAALRASSDADTIVDLEVYSRMTTVFSLLAGARNRLGFYLDDIFWRRYLHTHLVFFNRSAPVYTFYDEFARLLGATPASLDDCRAHLLEGLASETPPHIPEGAIALSTVCSELGRERMLTVQQWVYALRSDPETRGRPLVLLGGKDDVSFCRSLAAAVEARLPGTRIVDLAGKIPLATSVAALARCASFWGIDSGLLHYARLLGVPTTSFWGPTDPATRLRPLPELSERVRYKRQVCSPCTHSTETPPCHGRNVCIANLFKRDGEELPPRLLAFAAGGVPEEPWPPQLDDLPEEPKRARTAA